MRKEARNKEREEREKRLKENDPRVILARAMRLAEIEDPVGHAAHEGMITLLIGKKHARPKDHR